MDELEAWGLLKSKEFSKEWLEVVLNHMKENAESLNSYLSMVGLPPRYGESADKALYALRSAKITDEDVESVAWDVLQLSKRVETEEDLCEMADFKKILTLVIVKSKLQ